MKRIDNRQKNLAHRVSGRPYSAATGTDNKRRKIPVVAGIKRKDVTGRSKVV